MIGCDEYRFAEFRIDTARRELRRGTALVSIEPKAFDLLCFLIENRDRAVDKQELQDRIWAGTIVTEAALTRCVSKIRRALQDEARESEMVKTIHGHGYRFVAELTSKPLDAASDDRRQFPKVPDKPSIAVLPFDNLSGDPKQQYFSDGITEEIITALSRFSSLFVISQHSSFSYRGRDVSSQEVGRELGIVYVIEGGVRRSGNRIRVSARLLEASSGKHLWADRYERELEDIFAVQDELTATIVATVGGRVVADEWRRARSRPVNARSYDLVLQGQALHFQVVKQANERARVALRQALELDPGNPRAHSLMGAVKMVHFSMGWSVAPDEDLQSALQHGRRAVQLDATDSQAHAHLGETLLNCRKFEDARIQFEKAVELNPTDIISRALYSLYFCQIGAAEAALEQLELVQRLDPFELSWIPWFRGETHYLLGNYQHAIESLLRVCEPINDVQRWIAASYAQLGEVEQARSILGDFLEQAAEEMPLFPGWSFAEWKAELQAEYPHEPYARRLCEGLEKAWPSP